MRITRPPGVEVLGGAISFALPIVTTLALYLPGGVLMPSRVALAALMLLGVSMTLRDHSIGAPATLTWCLVISTVVGTCGVIGTLRSGNLVIVEAACVFLILAAMICAAFLSRSLWLFGGQVAGWVASMILAAVVAVWELTTSRNLPLSVGSTSHSEDPDWDEITSFFDNPNLYAYHCVVGLLLLPVAWQLLRSSRWRWSLPALGVVVTLLLVRTNGRMALLALVLGSSWWALRSRLGRVFLLFVVVVGLGTALLDLPPGSTVVKAAEVAVDGLRWEGKSTFIRMALLENAAWVLGIVGIFGAGTGGFESWASTAGSPAYETGFSNAHWGMIEVLVNYGLPSLVIIGVALALGVALATWRGVMLRRHNDALGAAVAHGAAALALSLPVISMSHSTWLVQPLTAVHVMTMTAAFAVAENRWRRFRSTPDPRCTTEPLQESDNDD